MNNAMPSRLDIAIWRLEDMLAGDDGQAFKEAQKFLERVKADPPKFYRTRIGNLVAAIQAAAIEGFALQCVAAGSMWATFELTAEEVAKLQQHKIFIEEDK